MSSRAQILYSVLFSILILVNPVCARFYQDDFKIGDFVELEFLGKKHHGNVYDFTGTGWPKVKFEYRGKTIERFFPPSRLTLVQSAESKPQQEVLANPAKTRKWTDSSGSFTVDAKLVSANAATVKLERTDGRMIALPLSKLSESDKSYLANLKVQKSATNPFAAGEMKTTPKATSGYESDMDSTNIKSITPDFQGSEKILSNPGTWSVTPDSADPFDSNQKVINFKSSFRKHAFHSQISNAHLTNDGARMVATITNPFETKSEILIANLETAISQPPLRIDSKGALLLAANEKQAVTIKKTNGRTAGELEFWALGDQALKTSAWQTSSFFDRNGFAPKMGMFIGENRLLTAGRRLALWDCESATAIYSYAISEATQPAISSTGKQLAVSFGNAVFIINSNDGNVLGIIEPPTTPKFLTFSRNGEQLAGINSSSGEIWVWSLSENRLIQELSAPSGVTQSLHWVGERYLLVNHTHLIDVRLRATVWSYLSTGGTLLTANDGRFWFAGKTKISPISFPGINLNQRTAPLLPEDLLVLSPGSELCIQLDLPFKEAVQDKIRDRITANLEKNGVTVRDQAELRLEIKLVKGKQEKVEMSSITDPLGRRGTESIKYTPQIGSVTLVKNEINVWQKSRRFGPRGLIQLKQGESVQGAVKRLCKPDPPFFESVSIPKYIGQLPDGKPFGESTISEHGIH